MALLLAPLRWLLSSIFRLAIFAAALVALYFLLLKPAIHSGTDKVNGAERTFEKTVHSLEHQVAPKRLAHCIDHAGGDVHKLQRCATKL
jgi:hypothetical protein